MYKELSSQLNFPELEERILEYWDKYDIFKKSINSRDPDKRFVFFEGPPTANGKPGIHHVISRTIKDFVCRHKTMQGFRVERKAGWDTHGLPVEIEVEKQLGFTNKDEIEKYGVDKFNEKCRESVWKYKSEWDYLTKRIAYWVDLDNPYITYENDYMESVWWILSELWKKELVYEGHKIVPYCPRCETPLSSHEVSQGYKDVEDPSVFVKMRLKTQENTSFLVWTTTPWTLISNVAVALHPDIKYVKVQHAGEHLILAEARLSVLGEGYTIVSEYAGSELLNLEYEPLFSFVDTDARMHYSVNADFVSTEDGTGIVHMAPAFGEDDYKIGQQHNLPVLQPVNASGKFNDEVTPFKGKFVKDADPEIIADLENRGLLFKTEKYLHSYPHCWRCSSPLLYFARKSWFIRTTQLKDRLIHHNNSIAWYPKEVGQGRFGEWLENNVDWSLSRDRYWGTPLPIWVCNNCEHAHCIGSVEELLRLSDIDEIKDLHKPYIDEVHFPCTKCDGSMTRVSEVIDVWFDSGSMPIAQWHYPFENKEQFEQNFPGDFISEGIDQTRGWFYSLLAISTMLFDKPSYRACVSNDLILDKLGQKMSKSKGNTVEPNSILSEYGADSLRWYLLAVSPPWVPTRFDTAGVKEVLRKFMGTLLNVYSFFALYANIDAFTYEWPKTEVKERTEIDRWLISSLNALVANVEVYLNRYDLTKSARAISGFVIDDLSNWYVRRCRRRFWKSEMGQDKLAAYETLYEALLTLSKLMAPYIPFISEEIYLNLKKGETGHAESVHLTSYPRSDSPEYSFLDEPLVQKMNSVRRVVVLGRSLRNESGIKVRQPLARIIIVNEDSAFQDQIREMQSLILEELNVKAIEFIVDSEALTKKRANPKFKELGPKLGGNVKAAADIIRAFSPKQIAGLVGQGQIDIQVNKKTYTVDLDDVDIISESAQDRVVGTENDFTIALDLKMTDALKNEGLAREFVNRVQNMRKNAGFDVIDRINIYYQASDDLGGALQTQSGYICDETLAVSMSPDFDEHAVVEEWQINGSKAVIGIKKLEAGK